MQNGKKNLIKFDAKEFEAKHSAICNHKASVVGLLILVPSFLSHIETLKTYFSSKFYAN